MALRLLQLLVLVQSFATSLPAPNTEMGVLIPSKVEPGAQLERVCSDVRAFQGIAWDPKGQRLYMAALGVDAGDTQVLFLDPSGSPRVWLDRSGGLLGMRLSRKGLLVGAQAFRHRIVSLDPGKKPPSEPTVLLENSRLNQPNDLCVAANGDLYFTDPDFVRRTHSAVYLLRRSGELIKLISEMSLPNGLELSLDGRTLYVSDSHDRLWKRYPLMSNGVTGPGSVFFDPDTPDRSSPDGMGIDSEGSLYLTGRGGVWVVTGEGQPLGLIAVPEHCSSVAFGDRDRKSLYIGCDQAIYRLRLKVSGGAAGDRVGR